MPFAWTELAAGNVPPPYRPQPAVVARYEPTAAATVAPVYLRADRHRLRMWSSPDPDKLNRFVDRIDSMSEADAKTTVDALRRKP